MERAAAGRVVASVNERVLRFIVVSTIAVLLAGCRKPVNSNDATVDAPPGRSDRVHVDIPREVVGDGGVKLRSPAGFDVPRLVLDERSVDRAPPDEQPLITVDEKHPVVGFTFVLDPSRPAPAGVRLTGAETPVRRVTITARRTDRRVDFVDQQILDATDGDAERSDRTYALPPFAGLSLTVVVEVTPTAWTADFLVTPLVLAVLVRPAPSTEPAPVRVFVRRSDFSLPPHIHVVSERQPTSTFELDPTAVSRELGDAASVLQTVDVPRTLGLGLVLLALVACGWRFGRRPRPRP